MSIRGNYLPIYLRFAFFLLGIAFLGSISSPLQAADNPPSAWNRIFGSETKTPENEPKSKPKKTKTEKASAKAQKNSKASKSKSKQEPETNSVAEGSNAGVIQSNPEGTSPPVEKTPEKPSVSTEGTPPVSLGTFFKGIFGGASSSSAIIEGSSQAETPKTLPSAPISTPVVPAAPASAPSTTTTAPINGSSTATDAPKTESFWKRMFGGASSTPPDTKLEPTSTITPAANPAAAPATPAAETPAAPAQPVTIKQTTASEEPSFWQKLFGSKSSVDTGSKARVDGTKPNDKTAESAPSNNISETNSVLIPATILPTQGSSDAKANFSLANVCEREKCELMLVYNAPINKSNVEKFIQSTASIPPGTVVLFNSIDGDLNSGIKLGQALRQKRFNARVGRTQLNKKVLVEVEGQCFSACVLALAGGVNRRIDLNDQIGIYALRSNTKTVNENEMRAALNGLNVYFDQMGVDRRLVEQMLQVKGSAVSLISLSNAKLLGLDNTSRATTFPWRMQALDDGLLIALVTEKQASGNFTVTLGLHKQNKEVRLTAYIKPATGSPNLNQLADFLNRNARLQMSFSNQTLSPALIKPWESTGTGIQTMVPLSDKDLAALSSALEFELELAQINRNPYNLDSVTIFGTLGLKGALTALKK